MFLATLTPAGSNSSVYKFRITLSGVLCNQVQQSMNFDVVDFKQELLMPSFTICTESTSFQLASMLTKMSLA